MTSRYAKRLQKELLDLKTNPPPCISITEGDNLDKWVIAVDGTEGSIYQGEHFKLQFKFSSGYPLDSPEVIFIGTPPIHPHIYSNGHICLSILYDNWSPALTVSSVCLSILSMLSGCTEKIRPTDDSKYVSRVLNKSPKEVRWMFHDDTV
ncbi:ubiquitin-conjugating enzyme E2W [Dictyostelium discoideum AX4]|uniref:Probable ubiquitin-conjugating enzyme E2 W n=1 Tax=Dictyostelium discoideum TaxID=44689 RepID=UBE2W_DICDI|nr:ubiquitin-conjugating enzyme E2W [Dictyostelium discoideum AX4]Q55EY8.1 RecName: Full=Probable ubiquitin-conjugating enzyme E2 W; AltName: Full=E2 ubiquitin-conjugating enzyme W; AltName: Full=N-terminal E2 ubiquitin-conjugating enzyme; AltName: Full=Ubiquitin carrier protein W; AltName: Full=Ubiquitin-protein ligase W [Dictyostelium discoideum]EAL73058.1 ubiquitin-conjugating enzyme E2W [Dictyostelium discoideum AX4]|eukprot:XP_646882.1 ubiquitin-conjugating enzyme E2W [Dictyostelium discoideum AX4]